MASAQSPVLARHSPAPSPATASAAYGSHVPSWKTPFEVFLHNRTPGQIASRASATSVRPFSTGLRVRVRGGELRARYNETSRQSVAPLLKARLVPEAAGTRIVGHVYWTVLRGGQWVARAASLLFVVVAVITALERSWLALWWAVCALFFGFIAFTLVDGRNQAFEVQRLKSELKSL